MKATSDEALLTLVAIKILNEYFYEKKKLWALVDKKARKALIPILGVDKKDLADFIEANLSELNDCFDGGRKIMKWHEKKIERQDNNMTYIY